jgi:tRNA nucleotidyltransferase (CCA-adding enzyme)
VNPPGKISTSDLGDRLVGAPAWASVEAAARDAGAPVRVVGGAVRDALLGHEPGNLDLVVEGDPAALIAALGGDAAVHDRFGTAVVTLADGSVIDVARARTETYARPGALPDVRPAGFDEDIGRRDFTINAMAVDVADPGALIDPLDGLADLEARTLRVLHDRSFADDPTRALRGARYAARLAFGPEPATLELLRATDLTTVSRERVAAELGKLAAEPGARRGFELLDEWGLMDLPRGAGQVIDRLGDLLSRPPWSGVAARPAAVLAAVRGASPEVTELAASEPASPSRGVAVAHGRTGVELVLARALGAAWLDDYVGSWRDVRLDVTGDDLIAAGIEEGPALGRGLSAALRAKLDGEVSGRDEELQAALDAARS